MDTSSEPDAEAPAVIPRLHATAAIENQECRGLFMFKTGHSKRQEAEKASRIDH